MLVKKELVKNMYDVIVVGGGHAGCEACLATSRKRTQNIVGNRKY